ncbi:hypothetical protein [Flavobacterium sp. N2820]|uniref:hypothetical protein n=1 Tax=Flavobacterium sp. N2820 TaxID=2986834 RepID=UPI002225B2A5|nr:hypothetical protein [Flavobacterium sp. N2820]
MRFVRSLLMLLMLVTFSTGFGSTTTDLKQNSKDKHVVTAFKVVAPEFVSVVSFESSVLITENYASTESTNFVTKKVFNPNIVAVISDVGWRNYQERNKDIPYKEKLIDNYNYKNKLNKVVPEHRIRDNPFDNSPTFLIKRYY